ncbi:MAG TPA: glycosyltransferase [Candidatus Paceibacterota bacterium]
MLKEVILASKVQAKDFLKFAPAAQKSELLRLGKVLRGKKIVHVNAVAQGGGVAELLTSVIPYMRALGIDASWYAIDAKKAGKAFFAFTNNVHNALQGSTIPFSKDDWKRYEEVNKEIAQDLGNIEYDILVMHDPQPLAALRFIQNKKPAVCVIHIDTSASNTAAWKKIQPFAQRYNRILFSNKDFVNPKLATEKLRVFPPAIDPLAYKQKIVSRKKAREYLANYGISKTGPLLAQVSRFDVWKNPHGVVEAFWLLEKKYPKAQLLLVGFQEARDNPQAEKVYMDIRAMAGKDPGIFLFFDPRKIGGAKNIQEFTVMAQNAADIVIQNSVKEGFGLTVTEAMWKGKPVIGGSASGIRLQIAHNKNGFIAENTKDLAMYMDFLLSHPKERARAGKAAKESVRKRFLMPRFVLNHLKVYKELV